MKRIGSANDGGHIVELSNNEAVILYQLKETMRGATYLDMVEGDYFTVSKKALDADYGLAFMAIKQWVILRMKVNDLHDTVARMYEHLGEAEIVEIVKGEEV